MAKVDRLHNRVGPFAALFWALGMVGGLLITDKLITDKLTTFKLITDKLITDKLTTYKLITDKLITYKLITNKLITDMLGLKEESNCTLNLLNQFIQVGLETTGPAEAWNHRLW